MKLSDIEKSQLKLLYDKGYRFLARDDSFGLCAYKEKPRLCVSQNPACYFRSWLPTNNCEVIFMHDDYFLKVGFEPYPYKITPKANLVYDRPRTKKAVAV